MLPPLLFAIELRVILVEASINIWLVTWPGFRCEELVGCDEFGWRRIEHDGDSNGRLDDVVSVWVNGCILLMSMGGGQAGRQVGR